MNKTELVEHLALEKGFSKTDARHAVDGVISVIIDSLKRGEPVKLPGFGAFQVTDRDARMSRNPKTGEAIHVPASKAPRFRASKSLRKELN